MNKHLSTLLNGYQDMVDRYGDDDPLVLHLKDAVDRCRIVPAQSPREERRRATVPSGIWNREPRRVATRP